MTGPATHSTNLLDVPLVEYQRSIAVTRIILLMLSIVFWLIVAGHWFDVASLQTSKWTPVLIVAVISTLVTWLTLTHSSTRAIQRYHSLGLLLPLFSIFVVYQNGYLPITFAPIVILLTQTLYRGPGSRILPYLVWLCWSLALYMSPVKEGQPFALRLMAVTLVIIPIADQLLRKENWERNTKDELFRLLLGLGIPILSILALQQFADDANVVPAFGSLLLFISAYVLTSKDIYQNRFVRLGLASTIFSAYWFSVAQNGVLPTPLVGGFVLISFLLLPAFEALFFSLGLIALSQLPLLELDSGALDFAPAPFFLRHIIVTFMLVFALYVLFTTREQEITPDDTQVPIFGGLLIATSAIVVLSLIQIDSTTAALTSTLQEGLGRWLVTNTLIWLFITWMSSVYLRNQTRIKLTVTKLAQARRSLEEQLERQREMFAVISHELRTPAASLSMMLHERTNRGEKDNEQTQMMNLSDHLVSVLDDLRQVVQPEQPGQCELKNENLFELVEQTVNSLAATLSSRHQRISLSTCGELPKFLLVDRKLIRQLVTNLVKNASVHSGASEISVQLTGEVQGDNASIQLDIEDNGSGLDESMQQRLFQPFARGATDADGTGLGLYICKQLAQLMGGELSYQPREGGGSRFSLKLSAQVARADAIKPHQTSELRDSVNGKRVLLAEDNKTIQMITAKMLERAGAHITLAENGKAALDLYQHTPEAFDLVLTDIMMPQMDGYQLTHELRALGCTLPIIGVTAATIGDEREQLLKHGATQVVAKPITMDALQRALKA